MLKKIVINIENSEQVSSEMVYVDNDIDIKHIGSLRVPVFALLQDELPIDSVEVISSDTRLFLHGKNEYTIKITNLRIGNTPIKSDYDLHIIQNGVVVFDLNFDEEDFDFVKLYNVRGYDNLIFRIKDYKFTVKSVDIEDKIMQTAITLFYSKDLSD